MRINLAYFRRLKSGEWFITDQEDKNVTSLAVRINKKVTTKRMILVDREHPETSIKVVRVEIV